MSSVRCFIPGIGKLTGVRVERAERLAGRLGFYVNPFYFAELPMWAQFGGP